MTRRSHVPSSRGPMPIERVSGSSGCPCLDTFNESTHDAFLGSHVNMGARAILRSHRAEEKASMPTTALSNGSIGGR